MTANGQPHTDTDSRPDTKEQPEAAGVAGIGGRTDNPDLGIGRETATRAGGSDHPGGELHQRDETAEPGDTPYSDAPLRLTALIQLTEGRPPRISVLIHKLHRGDNAQDRAWFEELLRQTVPEQAWEILQLDNGWDQVMSFAARFTLNHFPLAEDHLQIQADWRQEEPEVEYEQGGPYSLLREGIPFELMGFTWDELHMMWDQTRSGLPALALLAEVPRDEADASYEYDEFQGLRQTWLESAADVIPTETLRRIPEGG